VLWEERDGPAVFERRVCHGKSSEILRVFIGVVKSKNGGGLFCGADRMTLAYTDARAQNRPKTEILRISGGIPDICEFRPIAFQDENASEKTPPRERRARQTPQSRTLQNFGQDFTTEPL
jgi:hypothetical protein